MPHSSTYTGFFQPRPNLPDPYTSDILLHRILNRHLGKPLHSSLRSEFVSLSSRAISPETTAYAEDTNRNLPSVVHFDGWGNRVDHLLVGEGWRQLKRFWAESGLLGDTYLRRYGDKSRLVGFTKYVIVRLCVC